MKTRSSLAIGIAFTLVVLLVTPLRAQFAYVTNFHDNTVSGYSIEGKTGALTPVPGSPFAAGIAPGSVAVDHATLYEPDQRHCYAALSSAQRLARLSHGGDSILHSTFI